MEKGEPIILAENPEQVQELPPKVFHLHCVVCNAITGSLTLPGTTELDPETATNADLGFGDSRCDACLVSHGNFKDGSMEFVALGGDHETFVAAVAEAGGDVNVVVEAKQAEVDAEIDQKIADDRRGDKA